MGTMTLVLGTPSNGGKHGTRSFVTRETALPMPEPLSVVSLVVSFAMRKDAQCSSAAEMEPKLSLQRTLGTVSAPEERMTSGHLVRADGLKTLWAGFA